MLVASGLIAHAAFCVSSLHMLIRCAGEEQRRKKSALSIFECPLYKTNNKTRSAQSRSFSGGFQNVERGLLQVCFKIRKLLFISGIL